MIFRTIGAALIAATATLAGTQSQALTTYSLKFTVDYTDPDVSHFLGTMFFGTLTIDESLLDVFGDGTLIGPDLALDFTFDGDVFDETFDVDYPALPEVSFFGFAPVFIDLVLADGVNGADFSDPDVYEMQSFGGMLDTGMGVFQTGAQVYSDAADIPVPATLPLILAGVAGLGMLRRNA